MASEYLIQTANLPPPLDDIFDNAQGSLSPKAFSQDQAVSDEALIGFINDYLKFSDDGFQISSSVGIPDFVSFSSLGRGIECGSAVCRISKKLTFEEFKEIVDKIVQFESSQNEFRFQLSKLQIREIFSIKQADEAALFDSSVDSPSQSLSRIERDVFDRFFKDPMPLGTGFLVGNSYVMTNAHVIPSLDSSEQYIAQFDVEVDTLGRSLEPINYRFTNNFFVSGGDNVSGPIDYSILKLEDRPFDLSNRVLPASIGVAGHTFSWIPLSQLGRGVAPKLSVEKLSQIIDSLSSNVIDVDEGFPGESVSIIQHPRGKFKQIVLSGNCVTGLSEKFIRYEADATWGSSGAPVFNQQWELVALQHASVARLDDRGQLIIKTLQNGRKRVEVVAQQGVRIDQIIQDLVSKKDTVEGLSSFLEDFVQLKTEPLPIPLPPPPVPGSNKPNGDWILNVF